MHEMLMFTKVPIKVPPKEFGHHKNIMRILGQSSVFGHKESLTEKSIL